MPANAQTAIRTVAQRLKDTRRASNARRVNGKLETQRQHAAAWIDYQRRYNADPEAFKAQYTWECAYCGKIQEPLVIPLVHREGVKVIPRDRCWCTGEQEAMRRDAEEHAKHKTAYETHQWLAYMRRAGLVGWLATATFESYTPETHQQEQQQGLAELYCEALLEGQLGYKPWLVFHGPFGTGKTHLAAAILHEAMRAGWERCRLRVWPEWLERLQETFGGNGNAAILVNEMKSGKLIILDDVDKQHPTRSGWAEEKLYTVLNHRYNAGLPTILTFNHSPPEMEPWLGRALVDRMMEVAFSCIEFGGTSYRSGINWDGV